MSPENAHKLIRIYMGGLILGVNTLYMLSCFLKQFSLVGNGLITIHNNNVAVLSGLLLSVFDYLSSALHDYISEM